MRLKIVNGLLAYIDVKNDGEPDNRKTTKFYDFGTTVVELPEFDEKKPGVVLTAGKFWSGRKEFICATECLCF